VTLFEVPPHTYLDDDKSLKATQDGTTPSKCYIMLSTNLKDKFVLGTPFLLNYFVALNPFNSGTVNLGLSSTSTAVIKPFTPSWAIWVIVIIIVIGITGSLFYCYKQNDKAKKNAAIENVN
jgi:hypothetical protein